MERQVQDYLRGFEKVMKFDYCISNPAFNVAETENVAGTGGNTTLYRKATRNDFDNRLKVGGTLINITLKGIIPDLLTGYFKDYQVNWIHMMDDIDVWPYNTCIFSVTKKPRVSPPVMLGGLAAKIYSTDDCFPFVYYSGANNGMNKKFHKDGKNKVVRQLPGKGRDAVAYDYTDEEIAAGPKFAFYVMESKKSYTVTSEPVYGGTICYVPFDTEDEAKKMKLFVEKNPIFKEYVKRMKIRGHAFGLRYVKKFDVNQIVTGLETPEEWNIIDGDMTAAVKMENNITEDRNRVKALGEVFTPTSLVEFVLDCAEQHDPTAFANNSTTFIDSMCGDGQFLVGIRDRLVKNSVTVPTAVSNIYGIDLTQDNIDVAKRRVMGTKTSLQAVVDANITCADSFSSVFT
jgi:hypothetical protein